MNFRWFCSVLLNASVRSIWQRRVSCMREGMFTPSGTPSSTSKLDIYICPYLNFVKDGPLANAHRMWSYGRFLNL